LTIATTVAVLTAGRSALKADEAPPAYKNSALSVEARVNDLVGLMTVEEKARQLDMYFCCEDFLDPEQRASVTHARPEGIVRSLPAKQIRVKLFRARPVGGHQFNPTETSRCVFQLSLSRSVAHLFVLLVHLGGEPQLTCVFS